jgi:KDO2-lipid IV(A) lauroyltransferase
MLILKLLSLVPLRILYLLSDVLYIFSYYIFQYRKKVIKENLYKAFPEKTPEEINWITKKFYRNLTDIVVEIIKVLSLKKEELDRRVIATNINLPLKHLQQNESIIVLAGHQCNWEWLLSACMLKGGYPIDAVYKPLNSKFSDKLMLTIRSKFGATPVSMKDTLREQIRKKNIPHGLAMVADQTPLKNEIQYWTTFFNQDTPYYVGSDKIARLLNMPVFFVGMKRVKRGFYEITFKELGLPPYTASEFDITEKYNQLLEEEIRNQPENWLWSHRRWKHKKE